MGLAYAGIIVSNFILEQKAVPATREDPYV